MAGAKRVDARVLEEPADQRLDANIVGKAWDARPQTANSAYHDIDLDAFATGGVESVDDLRIDERIAFDPDLRRLAQSRVVDFIGDIAQQCFLERDRRNRHLLEAVRLGIAGDEIEDARNVPPDRRISSEKRNVGINPGR